MDEEDEGHGVKSIFYFGELSSLRSLISRLGNSISSETAIRGFGGKDVLSPNG